MLEFIADERVFHAESLQDVEPVTLETYEELLTLNERPIFCILVCENAKHVYFAQSIIGVRYVGSDTTDMSICRLRDPLTRSEVDNILYFEVKHNTLFDKQKPCVVLVKDMEQIKDTSNAPGARDTTIRALFLCNEFDLFHKMYHLQDKIFRDVFKRHSRHSIIFIGLMFIMHSVLFFFLIIACFYFLLNVVLQ